MPRRIIFKETDNIEPTLPGFSALGITTTGKTVTANEEGTPKVANDSNSTTLMSDAQFYTAKTSFGGTSSIYAHEHWGVFNIGKTTFHLCEMLYKLPTHDFDDANGDSKKIWGIFKENGNLLQFVDSFDVFDELGTDFSEYFTELPSGYAFNYMNYYSIIKNNDGLKVLQIVDGTNLYIQYSIGLNSNGEATSFQLLNTRKLSDSSYKTWENINDGYFIIEHSFYSGGNLLDGTFHDGTKIPFIRTDGESTWVSGDVIDMCQYNLITDETTVLISDLESWWNTNADEAWEIDGGIPIFKGGIISHPDSPLFICSRSTNFFDDSVLVTPTKFHRFGDCKQTDYMIRHITKDKIYIGNLLIAG